MDQFNILGQSLTTVIGESLEKINDNYKSLINVINHNNISKQIQKKKMKKKVNIIYYFIKV